MILRSAHTFALVITAVFVAPMILAQPPNAITIHGTVVDSTHQPVADASVKLEQKGQLGNHPETKTNPQGAFAFAALEAGSYTLSAEKSGMQSRTVVELSAGDQKQIELVLTSPEAMQFADQPDFTVAGVTDWTAVGGHGSDTSLRTSEALARETLSLKSGGSSTSSSFAASEPNASESNLRAALANAPGSFEANHQLGEFYCHRGRFPEAIPLLLASYQLDPANRTNEYALALAYQGAGDYARARDHVQKLLAREDTAELHRLAADLDEQLGDPLAAVREDEQAARLDPSEQNYFEWGSELLLHRALQPAVEVFEKGASAYPKSARMLAAQGAALFAVGSYDDAALRICDASDLNPADPAPYIFLGRIEMASPLPLTCVDRKLARFAQQQPGNALANYYYAMAIWKRQPDPSALQNVEALLKQSVAIDPRFEEGYLQLGIFFFNQRDFKQAIALYTKAIEVNPQLSAAHYRLGVAYERTGEPARARQEFQLHEEIEKQQAAAIESQRREIKQFLVILKSQPVVPPVE